MSVSYNRDISGGSTGNKLWTKVTKTFSDFSDPTDTKTITIGNLPSGSILAGYGLNVTIGFKGGSASDVNLTNFVGTKSVFDPTTTAPTISSAVTTNFTDSPGVVQLTLTVTDDTLNHLTQGSLDFYLWITDLNND